jgi:3-isopropylmalate/(R)-2-methylmalate dehydratase small subunit
VGTRFEGRVAWVFPDDFHTPQIIGAQYMYVTDTDVLAEVCMRDFEPDFRERTSPGDILVAGRNFGYGQPNELAMTAMRRLGIALVVAESFGPMFERSNRFQGLPLLTCPGIRAAVQRGEVLAVDWEIGLVTLEDGRTLQGVPPGDRAVAIAKAGGWINFAMPVGGTRAPEEGAA